MPDPVKKEREQQMLFLFFFVCSAGAQKTGSTCGIIRGLCLFLQ
jgi:hypothetical protein